MLEDVEGPCDTSAGRAFARRPPAPACHFLPPDIYENSCTLSSGEGQARVFPSHLVTKRLRGSLLLVLLGVCVSFP